MSDNSKNNGASNEAFTREMRRLARQLGKQGGAESKRGRVILALLKMTADFGHQHAKMLALESNTKGREEQVQALRILQALPVVYTTLSLMILRGTPPPEEDDPNFGHYKFCLALYSFAATALRGGLAKVLAELPEDEKDEQLEKDEDEESDFDFMLQNIVAEAAEEDTSIMFS